MIFSILLVSLMSVFKLLLSSGMCLKQFINLRGNSIAGATTSTRTAFIALRGIPSNLALEGS